MSTGGLYRPPSSPTPQAHVTAARKRLNFGLSMANVATVKWVLSVPPENASQLLQNGLKAMGAKVEPRDALSFSANTPLSINKNHRAARWEVALRTVDEGSEATLVVTMPGTTHKSFLNELASKLVDVVISKTPPPRAWQMAAAQASERQERKSAKKAAAAQLPSSQREVDMNAPENADYARLPQKTRAAIDASLAEDEVVKVVIKGVKDCVIVGTDRRAFLFKRGMLAGATFGHKLASFDYLNISGVEVHGGMQSGAVILHVPGAISAGTSYWGQGKDDPWKAYNAIPILRPYQPIEEAAAKLRGLISRHQNKVPSTGAKEKDDAGSTDTLNALKQLGELRDSGVLTTDEFEAKKTELLKRL